jgi:hypothetical protein
MLNAFDSFPICGASCSANQLGPPMNLCFRGAVGLILAVHINLSICLVYPGVTVSLVDVS